MATTEEKFYTVVEQMELVFSDIRQVLDDAEIEIAQWKLSGPKNCRHTIVDPIENFMAATGGLQTLVKFYLLCTTYHARIAHPEYMSHPQVSAHIDMQEAMLEKFFASFVANTKSVETDVGIVREMMERIFGIRPPR